MLNQTTDLPTVDRRSPTPLSPEHSVDSLLRSVAGELTPSVTPITIVAGHYCVSKDLPELSNTGGAEAMSFLAGAKLVKNLQIREQKSVLLLWINDIGISPLERAALKDACCIPHNYLGILESEGLCADAVTVMFESSMRNRASTDLRKILKRKPDVFRRFPSDRPGLVRCVDPVNCTLEGDSDQRFAYVVDGPHGEELVVKEGSNPKCNFILANLISQIVRTYGSTRIVHIFNDLYISRIGLGIHVAHLLYDIRAEFTNLFSDGASLYFDHSISQGKR